MVTDKPSPLTVKLAQKSDGDNLSVLFDHNVTRGALKNLVTDKPSPITVKLAQTKQSAASSLLTLEKPAAETKKAAAPAKTAKKDDDPATMDLHGPAVVGGTPVKYSKNST